MTGIPSPISDGPATKAEILSFVESPDGAGLILSSEAPAKYRAYPELGYVAGMNFPAEIRALSDEFITFSIDDCGDFLNVNHPEHGELVFTADKESSAHSYVGNDPLLTGSTIQLIHGDSKELEVLCQKTGIIFVGAEEPSLANDSSEKITRKPLRK